MPQPLLAKIWKQPVHPQMNEEKAWYAYMQWDTAQPLRVKCCHCSDIDGLGGIISEISGERQCDIAYMQNLKKYHKLVKKKRQTHGYREQASGYQRVWGQCRIKSTKH